MNDFTWNELSVDLANTDLSVLNDQEVDEIGGAGLGYDFARAVLVGTGTYIGEHDVGPWVSSHARSFWRRHF